MPYGDSYGGVQSADLAEQGARRAGVETAINRFTGMLAQRSALADADREFKFRTDQAADHLAQAQQQLDLQKQNLVQSAAESAARLKQAQEMHDANLKYSYDALHTQALGGPQEKLREFNFRNYDALANAGELPEDVVMGDKSMTDTDRSILTRKNSAAQTIRQQQYDFADAVSKAHAQLSTIDDEIATAKKGNKTLGFWQNTDTPEIRNLVAKKNTLASFIQRAEKNPQFSQLVAPDDNGIYRPLIFPPQRKVIPQMQGPMDQPRAEVVSPVQQEPVSVAAPVSAPTRSFSFAPISNEYSGASGVPTQPISNSGQSIIIQKLIQARQAGVPIEQVIQRAQEYGIDPSLLGAQ